MKCGGRPRFSQTKMAIRAYIRAYTASVGRYASSGPRLGAARSAAIATAADDTAGDVREAHRFDESALEAYLVRHGLGTVAGEASAGSAAGTFAVKQFTHGQSNPTFRVELNGRPFVVRKQPPGALLRGAHAVDREHAVMTALGKVPGAGFPVPRTRLFCDDAAVLGTPFFVYDFVPGAFFQDPRLPELEGKPAARASVYGAMADTLGRLHAATAPGPRRAALGLEGYGKAGGAGFLARQVKVWSAQYAASLAGEARIHEMLTPRPSQVRRTQVL